MSDRGVFELLAWWAGSLVAVVTFIHQCATFCDQNFKKNVKQKATTFLTSDFRAWVLGVVRSSEQIFGTAALRDGRISVTKTAMLTLVAAGFTWPLAIFSRVRDLETNHFRFWSGEFFVVLSLGYLLSIWPNYMAYQSSAKVLTAAGDEPRLMKWFYVFTPTLVGFMYWTLQIFVVAFVCIALARAGIWFESNPFAFPPDTAVADPLENANFTSTKGPMILAMFTVLFTLLVSLWMFAVVALQESLSVLTFAKSVMLEKGPFQVLGFALMLVVIICYLIALPIVLLF